MSDLHELNVEPRDQFGRSANRRLRAAGKVPVVMYGAGRENANLVVDHDELLHKLEVESFSSALITVNGPDGSEQAILRDVQRHPYRPRVLHVDLQRVRATEKIHISVPIHFLGEEVAPGVKMHQGIVSHLMNDVDITCLPKDLPEYLEIDISALDLNESLHLSDIRVPDGVEITALAHGGEDLAIVAIAPPRLEVEAEEEEVEEGEEGVEAEERAAEEESDEKGEE